MSIRQRGPGSWQVSHTHAGRRYRRSFPSHAGALAAEAQLKLNLIKGDAPWSGIHKQSTTLRPADGTVGHLFELTHELRWQGKPSEQSCRSHGEVVVKILGRNTAITDVDEGVVSRLRAKLEQTYRGSTVNRKLGTLSAILSVAVEQGYLDAKVRPSVKIDSSKDAQRTRCLTDAEERELFARIAELDEGVHAMCVVLVETGARKGEALQAKWSDFTLFDTHAHTEEGSQKPAGLWRVRTLKSGPVREIPLSQRAVASIRSQEGCKSGPFVGMSDERIRYRWNQAKSTVKSLADEREVVPHCLRHTCASRLVAAGVNLLEVKEWLGHSNIKHTMVYAHLAPTALHNAYATLQATRQA